MATSLLFGTAALWASPVDAASPGQIPSSPILTTSGAIFAAVSPDGSTIFVTTAGASQVTRIDGATGAVLPPFALPASGAGMALTPDGQRLYVVIPSLGQVALLDAVSGNQFAVFGAGSGIFPGDSPWGIALSTDGTRAFVTERGTSSLAVFNAQSGAPIATVNLPGTPQMPSVHPSGSVLYVPVTGGTSAVAVVDVNPSAFRSAIVSGGSSQVAFSADGNRMYVPVPSTNSVAVVDTTNPFAPVVTGPSIAVPYASGVAMGAQSRLFVSAQIDAKTYYVDLPVSPTTANLAIPFPTSWEPTYLTATSNGTRLVLPLYAAGQVAVIDAGLRTVTFNANGGTTSMSPQSAYDDTPLTSNTFTRSGCSFLGWSSTSGIAPVVYADDSIYAFEDDTTLYAQWNVRSVTFNANGGSGSMAPQTDCPSAALTANSFTRSGYTFAGWSTTPGVAPITYGNQAAYPFTADGTLYAQWARIPPPPVFPPSAPQSVTATPGDSSATLTWVQPASSGTFPITTYQATVTPGGQSCLVTAPTLTCIITGLANGTTYSATVRALNGAGWGPDSAPSAAFTPQAPPPPPTPTISITGTRGDVNGRPGIIINGVTTDLAMGSVLRPWVRFPGQTGYTEGTARILVSQDSTFAWQRRTPKRTYVIIKTEDGTVSSNRLVIQAP